MAATDLISLTQAQTLVPNADTALLSLCVTASSNAVEKYCNRRFALQTYTLLLNGGGGPSLWLPSPPVVRIHQFKEGRIPALYVTNRDSNASNAFVEVTSTSLVLTKMKDAVTTTNTITFSSATTIGAMNSAINALGNDWSCTTNDQLSHWPTSELAVLAPTNYGARTITANLPVFYWPVSNYRLNAETGEVVRGSCWSYGYQNYYLQADLGYAEIPDEIEEVVGEMTRMTYIASKQLTPGVQSETLDKYSYTRTANLAISDLSPAARLVLNHYRLYDVSKYTAL